MTLSFTMRGGYHGGRRIRPSLWCPRGESYIFSDFLRRNAGTNSTAGTSFDFLAGFTAFIVVVGMATILGYADIPITLLLEKIYNLLRIYQMKIMER